MSASLAYYPSTRPQGRWLRTKRSNRCPICDHDSWCSISEDGDFAICMRVSADSLKVTRNNGYLHALDEDTAQEYRERQEFKPLSTTTLASIERRHRVYTAMLERLGLSGYHRSSLLNRGLSDDEITRNLYATAPGSDRASSLAEELALEFELTGVPGFFKGKRWYMHSGDWQKGFFIPFRDLQGRIQGLQIRTDTKYKDNRYFWWSSAKYPKYRPNGASPGAPIHFVRPWRAAETHSAIITEGGLKGDLISAHLDVCVIAVAGVSSFKPEFGETLKAELPDLKHIYIAYDSDWQTKPEVAAALQRLADSLTSARLKGEVLVWDGMVKGFDEFLVTGGRGNEN